MQGLGEKLSSLFSTLSSSDITVDGTRTVASDVVGADSDTYARHASIFIPSHSTSTALPSHRLPIPPASSRIDDRASNLILFGLSESPSIFETKKLVDEVLQFLAEGPVQIRDVFRLGKYNHNSNSSTRPRPVLIKLSTAWDRKAILLRKRNLQHFRISRLFLRADVPPDHQLRQTKTKAQSHVPSSFHSSVLVGKSVPSTVQVPSSQDIPCRSPPTHTHTIQDSTSSSLVPSDLHHHTAHSSSISSSSSTSTLVQDQDQGTTPPP